MSHGDATAGGSVVRSMSRSRSVNSMVLESSESGPTSPQLIGIPSGTDFSGAAEDPSTPVEQTVSSAEAARRGLQAPLRVRAPTASTQNSEVGSPGNSRVHSLSPTNRTGVVVRRRSRRIRSIKKPEAAVEAGGRVEAGAPGLGRWSGGRLHSGSASESGGPMGDWGPSASPRSRSSRCSLVPSVRGSRESSLYRLGNNASTGGAQRIVAGVGRDSFPLPSPGSVTAGGLMTPQESISGSPMH